VAACAHHFPPPPTGSDRATVFCAHVYRPLTLAYILCTCPSTKPRNSSPLHFPAHHPRLPCAHMKPSPPSTVRSTPLLAPGAIADGLPLRASRATEAADLAPQSRPLSSPQGEPGAIFFQVRGHHTGAGCIRPWNCNGPVSNSIARPLDTSLTALTPPSPSLLPHWHRLPTGRPPLPPRRLTSECLSSPLPQMGPPPHRPSSHHHRPAP
jgi:hypothetical protein